MQINIYRSGSKIADFSCAADGIATFTYSLMNEHKIVCQWISYEALGLMIDDYIEYNGIKFKINTPPSETKTASYAYQYQVTFEAPIYDLYNKIYSHDDGDGWVTEWNLGGSPEDFIDILLANLNSIDSGWTKGDIDTADDQLIDFTNVTCREALNTIAETFNMEWYLNNKEIHLIKKVGADSTLVFEYGQGKGLYELSRQAIDNKNLVTRLLVFGSDRNNNGKKLSIPAIDTNTDKYGIREAVKVFDEVYPHRESLIGTVAADGLSFQDSTMDFDLNDYLTTDTAQISFLSGDLVGYNLEITGYNATTKTFVLKKFTDTDGTVLPSDDDKPRTGDKYTIIGIAMPQTYIDAAIAELTTKGNDYAAENGIPRVQYACKLDMIWASDNNILVNIGDRVTVKDAAMGIDNQIRVSSVSFPLYQPFNMTFVIADSVGYTVQQRIIAKTIDNTKAIKVVDRSRELDARRAAANQDALRDSIFDPSGQYFDPANIKPQSIETLMLSVGAKSQNFQLSGAYIQLANNNLSATATAAKLIHNTMQIEGLGYIWDIASNGSLPLPTTSATYYLYAKCSATQLTGVWVVDTDQHEVDSETGYYWFLVGVIYPVNNGYRGISLTYGYASINGRTIIAGRVQSLDGNSWFDLDTGEFHGKFTFTSGSSGYSNITDKPDLSPFEDTTDYVNNTLPDVISGLQNQIDGQIESWFYPGVPTLTNPPVIYDGTDPETGWTTNAIKDKHLGDLYYNQTDGKGYRFSKTGSVYSWTLLADTDIALALSKADAAQDTADHKRRVFVAQPTTPYDIGDLWTQGAAGDIMRCQIARASGAYQSGDWTKASKYTDDTKANTALTNAENAQSTADKAKAKTDFINDTTIDSNFVATGTLLVGDASGANAGISGVTDGAIKWRFWAGADFATRINAPFRVNDDGEVWMNKIHLSTAISGKRIQIDSDATSPLQVFDSGNNKVFSLDVLDGYIPPGSEKPLGGGAGIRASAADGVSDIMEASSSGLYANGSAQTWFPATFGMGHNGSVVGLLRKRNSDIYGMSAGTIGWDVTNSGNSLHFGGLFNSIFNWGQFYFPVTRLDGSQSTYNIRQGDIYLSIYNSKAMSIYLPLPPQQSINVDADQPPGVSVNIGCTYYIRLNNGSQNYSINVYPTGTDSLGHPLTINGAVFQGGGGAGVPSVNLSYWVNGDNTNLDFNRQGALGIFTWDGQSWNYNLVQFITSN